MRTDLELRRKLTLRSGDRSIVLIKKRMESIQHVLMKAFIWSLYQTDYPELLVEVKIGDRYKPDVVCLDSFGEPVFWGEVGEKKIRSLARRFRQTHIAIAKWDVPLGPYAAIVREAVDGIRRSAPIDLLRFPSDSAERFIDDRNEIRVESSQIEIVRIAS
jgi:hypothetical protein